MKNTVYFDARMKKLLLESVEDDLNYIFLNITTDNNTDQVLQVHVNGVTTSYNLNSGVVNNFELASTSWALDSSTEFRLVNSNYTSQWYYIKFPTTVSRNFMLEEIDETHFEVNEQGSEDGEVKSNIIRYQNLRDYSIGTILTKICEINFATSENNTDALFNLTVNFEMSGLESNAESLVTLRLRINRAFDEYFIPMQTVKNGKHVLTISYPILGILISENNQVDVYLECSAGAVLITQKQLIASLMGVGLVEAGGWTGEIDIIELVEDFKAENTNISATLDSVIFVKHVPTKLLISDTVEDLQEVINMYQFNDSVAFEMFNIAFGRITEDGDNRITEDGNKRVTESEVQI